MKLFKAIANIIYYSPKFYEQQKANTTVYDYFVLALIGSKPEIIITSALLEFLHRNLGRILSNA
jgi:hypothetical protein